MQSALISNMWKILVAALSIILVVSGYFYWGQNIIKSQYPNLQFIGYKSHVIRGVLLNSTDVIKRAKNNGYFVGNVTNRQEAEYYGVDYPATGIGNEGPRPNYQLTFDTHSNVSLSVMCETKVNDPKILFLSFLDSLNVPRSVLDNASFDEINVRGV